MKTGDSTETTICSKGMLRPEDADPVLLEFIRELRAHSPAGDFQGFVLIGGPSPQFQRAQARMAGMAVAQAGLNAANAMRNVGHFATPMLAAATPVDQES
jgi:hypothetical protein